MPNYNRIIMIGNLTRDPEYKQLASGQALCKLGLASNRQFRSRQTDSMVQEVCFVDIDVWGPQAESCRQYLQKGRAVLVEGRLKFDTWQDNNGQTRSKHSIVADRVVFLSSAAEVADTASDTPNLRPASTHVKLPSSHEAATDMSAQSAAPAQDVANVQLEKELLDQIEKIKARSSDVAPATKAESEVKPATKKKASAKKETAEKKEAPAKENEASTSQGADQKPPSAQVNFKDEPPFKDELPF